MSRSPEFYLSVSKRARERIAEDIANGDTVRTSSALIVDMLRHRDTSRLSADTTQLSEEYYHWLMYVNHFISNETDKPDDQPLTTYYRTCSRALYTQLGYTDSRQIQIEDSRYLVHKPRGKKIALFVHDASHRFTVPTQIMGHTGKIPFSEIITAHLKEMIKTHESKTSLANEAIRFDQLDAIGQKIHQFGAHILLLTRNE